ncbi:MAG TPA: VOC family protein [Candidatus Dormibacteraeota bacterium]|jgi:catechol 2,3-dioxygenase-like lactoylglutathione lyase family enzyme
MSATGINHVSVHAADLDASEEFYSELFGVTRLPTPDFGYPVRWLKVGRTQLHLFNRAAEAPANHHFAFTVDDLEAVYRKAHARGALDRPEVRRLPDGSAQIYLRDPSGNLVECNAPDADSLDPAVVGELVPVGGEVGARLFL